MNWIFGGDDDDMMMMMMTMTITIIMGMGIIFGCLLFQANLGHMDTRAEQFKMIGGNLALTQVSNLNLASEKCFLDEMRFQQLSPVLNLWGLTQLGTFGNFCPNITI